MNALNPIGTLSGNSLSGLMGPGLSAGMGLTGEAAQRTAGVGSSTLGLAPMDMAPLMALVAAQEKVTAQLLSLLMQLIQGQAAGGAGTNAGGTAGAAGGNGAAGTTNPAAGAQGAGQVSADVGKWVTGDTDGLNAALLNKLAQVGQKIGKKVSITSGFRSRAEQTRLYNLYKAGKGNLAAKPGTSKHESGNAADCSVGGVNLGSDPKARAAALEVGLCFPVPGEPWHIQVGS